MKGRAIGGPRKVTREDSFPSRALVAPESLLSGMSYSLASRPEAHEGLQPPGGPRLIPETVGPSAKPPRASHPPSRKRGIEEEGELASKRASPRRARRVRTAVGSLGQAGQGHPQDPEAATRPPSSCRPVPGRRRQSQATAGRPCTLHPNPPPHPSWRSSPAQLDYRSGSNPMPSTLLIRTSLASHPHLSRLSSALVASCIRTCRGLKPHRLSFATEGPSTPHRLANRGQLRHGAPTGHNDATIPLPPAGGG